jgi:hypothetical protein
MPTQRVVTPPPQEPPTYRAPFYAGQPPPPDQPVEPAQPAEPPAPSRRRQLAVIGAVLAVVVLAVATTVVVWVGRDKQVAAPEIFLEPAAATGQNPFTPSASIPQPQATNPGSDPAGAPASDGAVRPTSATEPGLYGGTRNLASCDAEQMITYLGQNPDKGQAWASVFNITPDQIPAYIRELTPVLLRTDTRVTNHGFENGRATPFQSVLEAGTAVLVDKFGVPRVRCACGNPLLEPVAVSSAVYSNQRWAKFSPASLSLVQPSPTAIDTFVLYDPASGAFFGRPRGGNGTNDVDDPRGAAPPPPPTTETQAPPSPGTRTPTYTRTPYVPPPTTTPPTDTYTPPTTTYTPPTTTYTPPTTTYTPPTTTYTAPTATYEPTYSPPR